MKLMLMASTALNLMFMNTKQPMLLITIILMQTTMSTFMMSNFTKSSWFNYILMITFIGGMMVLFIYITSITPNEKNFNYMKMMPILICTSSTIMILNYKKKYLSTETSLNQSNLMNNDQLNMNMMFSYPLYSISMMMMIYLFIALIVINKISNIEKGPLRMNIH
uniref:NADH dehydrogenase subunit 6 n=1 Tax=Thoradonta yunnana TaxID=515186 RepID=UPI0023AAE58E|nr:NADH dehydrogenase subunit 6 [Thoradonta yunnana]WCF77160.1 NADH dehydrogenase subunit 6 [Thoradonta yunnana]WCK12010.1 NADH dehydrogenase subunit 6 [Thoradonta yunnana]